MSNLQTLREQAGFITVEPFALKADVSTSTVRRAEKGGRITRQNALRMAQALSVSLEDIEGLDYVGKGQTDGRPAQRLEAV